MIIIIDFHLLHYTKLGIRISISVLDKLPFFFIGRERPFGNIVLVTLFIFLKIRVDEKVCENTYNVI